jgi:hypothetical protein
VLAQDYPELDVVFSDDHSTDRTLQVLQRIAAEYRGPHRVRVRQNSHNLVMRHMPTVVEELDTALVIQFHGDDLAVPHRVSRVVAEYKRTGASLIGSGAMQIDADGKPLGRYQTGAPWRWTGPLDFIRGAWGGHFLGATLSYEPRLYRAPFPALDPTKLASGNDVILPFRAALQGGLAYIEEPLVLYRRHPGQLSYDLADWTHGRAAFDETVAAHHLMLQCQRLRDLDALFAAGQNPANHDALATATRAGIVDATVAWAERRATAMHSELRPIWVTRDVYRSLQEKAGVGRPRPAAAGVKR